MADRSLSNNETILEGIPYRMTEGPFCGQPLDNVPLWYRNALLCGGENNLIKKDPTLSDALARMGEIKAKLPKIASAPSISLGGLARNAPDKEFLLKAEQVRKAVAAGPGLKLEDEVDRGKAHDADMKRKLLGLRNNPP